VSSLEKLFVYLHIYGVFGFHNRFKMKVCEKFDCFY